MSWGVGGGGSERVSDSVSKSDENCRKVPKGEKCEKRGAFWGCVGERCVGECVEMSWGVGREGLGSRIE